MYTLERTQRLPISIQEAWDFFQNPSNLATITPDYMGFDIMSEVPNEMYPGLFIHYRVSPLLGIKMNWVTEITHIVKGTSFVDEQRFGPYKMWHHLHKMEKVDGGVLMTDIVHFKLPFSLIAPIVYSLFVKRKLTEIFNYRTTKLDELVDSNQLI